MGAIAHSEGSLIPIIVLIVIILAILVAIVFIVIPRIKGVIVHWLYIKKMRQEARHDALLSQPRRRVVQNYSRAGDYVTIQNVVQEEVNGFERLKDPGKLYRSLQGGIYDLYKFCDREKLKYVADYRPEVVTDPYASFGTFHGLDISHIENAMEHLGTRFFECDLQNKHMYDWQIATFALYAIWICMNEDKKGNKAKAYPKLFLDMMKLIDLNTWE